MISGDIFNSNEFKSRQNETTDTVWRIANTVCNWNVHIYSFGSNNLVENYMPESEVSIIIFKIPQNFIVVNWLFYSSGHVIKKVSLWKLIYNIILESSYIVL